MSINAQYKKGALELCVLSLLHKRNCCGYEIWNSYPSASIFQTGRSTRFCESGKPTGF